jgi:hypothetical protein
LFPPARKLSVVGVLLLVTFLQRKNPKVVLAFDTFSS